MLIGEKEAKLDDGTYDLESDELGAKPRRPGLPVEPRRLVWILAESRKALLKAFLISSVMASVAFFFLPKTYESSAQLLYQSTPFAKNDGKQSDLGAFVDSSIAPSRLREVRERLGWHVSLVELGKRVDAAPEGEVAMRIVGRAGTAEDARALTQTVLDLFLERQTKFNQENLERLAVENDAALARARVRRDAAQQAYKEFRTKSGKPDLIAEKEQLLARMGKLRASADKAAVEADAQQARIKELEKAQKELPAQIVASATLGSPVDTPLAQARAELAAARASLSDQHPTVQALKERVASLQAQRSGQKAEVGGQTLATNPARSAVDQQLATARAAFAAAKEREAALRVLLEANKKEVTMLAPEEDEARRVIGEVEQADKRIEELSKRGTALRDAQMAQLTGFRVLSVPMLPEEAKRSHALVVLLAMLPIVAVLIVALVSIMRRLRSLKVEAPREVAWWGNGPVLGTSVWPRDPGALDAFVNELEDHGVYGAGRTLVVPATETERDIACSFAMRLAEAPWLAAAILNVGARADADVHVSPLVTPAPGAPMPPRRLSSQGTPSVSPGRVIMTPDSRPPTHPTMQGVVPPPGSSTSPPPVVTPPPKADVSTPSASRPPRKQTMIGLPAVRAYGATSISTEPPAVEESPSKAAGGPAPFRRKRGARATVRMVVPVQSGAASGAASEARDARGEEEAFLLTRPVPVVTESTPSPAGRATYASTDSPGSNASNAVMRAAVRLLGNDADEITSLRRSAPPGPSALGDVTGVAITWNGPLSGPLVRRAARLAHRVLVVVSSGASVIDLARIKTRLGRDKGVGFVLVNVGDAYVNLHDRVGPVEEFWEDPDGAASKNSRPA